MEMTTNSLTVWFAIWSESSLLLHAIKHVLWAMAKANSFNYTGVFFFFFVGVGGGKEGMWKCNARFITCTCSM